MLFRLGYRRRHLQSFRNGFALRKAVDVASKRTMRLIVTLLTHRIRLTGQLVRPALRSLRRRVVQWG